MIDFESYNQGEKRSLASSSFFGKSSPNQDGRHEMGRAKFSHNVFPHHGLDIEMTGRLKVCLL